MMCRDQAFRFSYDEHGFYRGIVRRDSLGLFPENCTDFEPPWIYGRVPVWDFASSAWRPVLREHRERLGYEIGALDYFSEKQLVKFDLLFERVGSVGEKIDLGAEIEKVRVCLESDIGALSEEIILMQKMIREMKKEMLALYHESEERFYERLQVVAPVKPWWKFW